MQPLNSVPMFAESIPFLRKFGSIHALRRELAYRFFYERGWPEKYVAIYNTATDQIKEPCTLGRVTDWDSEGRWARATAVAQWDHTANDWVEIVRD